MQQQSAFGPPSYVRARPIYRASHSPARPLAPGPASFSPVKYHTSASIYNIFWESKGRQRQERIEYEPPIKQFNCWLSGDLPALTLNRFMPRQRPQFESRE